MHGPLGVLAAPWINWRNRDTAQRRAARAAVEDLQPAVVVTGASRGIGLALARTFLSKGHRVLFVARDVAELATATDAISAIERERAMTLVCDVTSPNAMSEINAALSQNRLYLDILVNNAGCGTSGPLEENATQDLERLIELNVAALTRLTRGALPDMLARGAGGILNVASLGGVIPGPNQAAYYASKAYVMSLTEAIASEASGRGVRISVVSPGPVATSFHAGMGADLAFYRMLLPEMTASAIACRSYRGFTLGQRVIVPGILYRLFFTAMRVLPHPISVPVTGWLLKNPAR